MEEPTEHNKLVQPRPDEDKQDIPVLDAAQGDKPRIYLMDTGASHDVTPGKHALEAFPECIRKLLNTRQVNTAVSKVEVTEGLRTKLNLWARSSRTRSCTIVTRIYHQSANGFCWPVFIYLESF